MNRIYKTQSGPPPAYKMPCKVRVHKAASSNDLLQEVDDELSSCPDSIRRVVESVITVRPSWQLGVLNGYEPNFNHQPGKIANSKHMYGVN